MQLGMVGLGRMGANLVRRLMRDGHECVVYDVNADAVAELEGEGATGAASLEEFVAKLNQPRAAWIMVPAAYAGSTVDDLAALMDDGRHHHRRWATATTATTSTGRRRSSRRGSTTSTSARAAASSASSGASA